MSNLNLSSFSQRRFQTGFGIRRQAHIQDEKQDFALLQQMKELSSLHGKQDRFGLGTREFEPRLGDVLPSRT